MVNILIYGCNGKMGRVLADTARRRDGFHVAAGVDMLCGSAGDFEFTVYPGGDAPIKEPFDVIIDFSHPSALNGVLALSHSRKAPVVIASTGYSGRQLESISRSAQAGPIFLSANMSLGVSLMKGLSMKAASALDGSGYDIEIIEKHHNQKVDAPSGTALMLAEALNEALSHRHEYAYDRHQRRERRGASEIGIHSVRAGTIAGEHSILFAGNDEIIEIKHTALSKEIFAEGALKAARFIIGKAPGLYSMDDLLKCGAPD